MAILETDLKWKFSIKTGSAGHSLSQSDPNASLGKYIATNEWAGGTLHDLFDAVTGDENAASDIEYRCLFIHNAHATLALQNPVVWISAEVAGGAVGAIAIDSTAQSVIGFASAQALEVANENTAPSALTFTAPTTKGTGLSLGATLDAGKCRAIWLRRTAANTAALNNDGVTLRVEGDTEA